MNAIKFYKTYLHYLERNRLFAFINVMGLGIALAFVILLGNLTYCNLTVDSDLQGKENFYFLAGKEMGQTDGRKFAAMHYNMGDRVQSQVAAVKDWCAFYSGLGMNPFVKYNNVNYNVEGLVVKKNFFKMFSFPLVEGNRNDALADPKSMVLTESGARKIFGTTTGVVGKMVTPGFAPDQSFRVTAVMKDFDNSLFSSDVEVVVPFENMDIISWPNGIKATQMNGYGAVTLIFEMQDGANPNADTKALTKFLHQEYPIYNNRNLEASWIPYSRMNLSDNVSCPVFEIYSSKLLMIYVFIGGLVLLLAILNYISMSVAQTSYRAKEMATRRLLGASRKSVFWRMICEAFMMTFLSFLVGILLAASLEDFASGLLGKRLDVVASLHGSPAIIYVLLLLLISFLAGLFPALLLSRFHALDVVKGTFRRKTKMVYLRVLYTLQGGICVGLLGCIFFLVVSFDEAMSRPIGYRTDSLLVYSTAGDYQSALAFVRKAEKDPYVKGVTMTANIPIGFGWNNTNDFRVGDSIAHNVAVEIFDADEYFTSVFGLEIQGDTHPTWDQNTFYVCKSFDDFAFRGADEIVSEQSWKMKKAGVYPDFRQGLPFQNDRYTVVCVYPRETLASNYIVVHTTAETPEVKARIDALYQSFYHMNELDSYWYSQLFKETSKFYTQFMELLNFFTITSIAIAMLGLTAFSIYYVGQRRRDMAIRKAFGSDNRKEMVRVLRYAILSLCMGLVVTVPFVFIPELLLEQVGDSSTFIHPYWTFVLAFFAIIGLSVLIVWLVTRKVVNESPINYLKSE